MSFGYQVLGFGVGSASAAAAFEFTVSSNTTNANIRTLADAAGYSGSGPITMTVNSGVYVYATSATPALTIAEDDATVINNGKILGKGGTTGKEAIYISSSGVTITNASGAYIAGGGGDGSYSAVTNSGQGGGGGGACLRPRFRSFRHARPWRGANDRATTRLRGLRPSDL